jgi:hypothetical protein
MDRGDHVTTVCVYAPDRRATLGLCRDPVGTLPVTGDKIGWTENATRCTRLVHLYITSWVDRGVP